MLDIKFLRENPDIVKENIKKKFQDKKIQLVDEAIKLDKDHRAIMQHGDELRNKRKNLSNEIGNLMKQGKKDEALKIKDEVNLVNEELTKNEAQDKEMQEKIKEIMYRIPNIMHESVPIGEDD